MRSFRSSDAWFLTTLLLLENPATLQEVIAAGDWLNHAIFTADEINRALSLFVPMGYVERDAEGRMRTTEKARAIRDKTFERTGAFGKIERTLAKLKKFSCEEPASVPELFSEAEVTEAYEMYVRELHSCHALDSIRR